MSEELMTDNEDLEQVTPAEAPVPEEYTDVEEVPAKKPFITRGTLRFYSLFLGCVLGLVIILLCLMVPLRMLLTQYETAQPQKTADEIYSLLFADPDWALLYDMAKIEGTTFEGRSAFVTYMENKVGDRELKCMEVPNGLSKDKRYSLRLGREEIASFTTYAYDDGVSTFPLWTLGTVELYFSRNESVTITKMPGYTVYINGVPLDDSYTVLYVETMAENYLPGELDGYHYVQQRVEGLLNQPDVVVVDENNKPLTLTQDPVTGVYSTEIPTSPTMTAEELQMILAAAQAELRFSVKKLSAAELRQYFDTNSSAYMTLNSKPALIDKCQSCEFLAETAVVKDFYRYDSSTFSARVRAEMNVVLPNGETQLISLDTTYIFCENNAGKYMVTDSVDANLPEVITSVLVEYVVDGEVIGSFVTDVNSSNPPAPMPEVQTGGAFLGWGKMNSDGSMTLVLEAISDVQFQVVPGQTLTYGKLYPVYGEEQ